jgi:hypothetical protein
VQRVLKVQLVYKEFKDLRQLGQQVLAVSLEHKEMQVVKVHRVLLEHKELRVQQVHKVRQV